ncbi:MAG: hypothetical protein ACFE0I_00685 [Elainellaceae cyanobacterium]
MQLLNSVRAIAAEPPSIPEPETDPGALDADALDRDVSDRESDADAVEPSDPLNSPYPVPWQWVVETQQEIGESTTPQMRYYRSDALVSPDGQYAAYSRIQLRVVSEPTQNQVSSILFLENLETGDLQLITASSPLGVTQFLPNHDDQIPGAIAILVPVSWSAASDRMLAREFESLFGTDLASDYAVIWDRHHNLTRTVAPENIRYTNAVLIGWSQNNPGQVLFRAGNLGDEQWPLYAVDSTGRAIAVADDQPIAFGRRVTSTWSGPQAYQ